MRIEDYALLSDMQTAALVGKDLSIDWLCVPRFDSDACFAALVGRPEHGRWLVAPAGTPREVRRRYHPGTLVLESEVATDEGTVRVVDAMPPRRHGPVLVRAVEGIRGRVSGRTVLAARFGYGKIRPWACARGPRTASLGLLSEQYDPRARRLLGNFPQAFSHVALVNTARTLTTPRGPAHRRAHGPV